MVIIANQTWVLQLKLNTALDLCQFIIQRLDQVHAPSTNRPPPSRILANFIFSFFVIHLFIYADLLSGGSIGFTGRPPTAALCLERRIRIQRWRLIRRRSRNCLVTFSTREGNTIASSPNGGLIRTDRLQEGQNKNFSSPEQSRTRKSSVLKRQCSSRHLDRGVIDCEH